MDREPSVWSKKCIEKVENREVLLKYGKNPTFYSESREDVGFFAVTSGSAAQSSIIDDFATPPFGTLQADSLSRMKVFLELFRMDNLEMK